MLRSTLATLAAAVVLGGSAVLGWSAPAGADTRSVTIVDNAFSPETVTVRVGDSVTWRNTGQRGHSVKADDNSFDSSPGCSFQNTGPCMRPNQTFSVTFSTPGTYFYYCNVHGSPNGIGMAGSVTVASEGTGGTTSTTAGATTSTTRRTTSTTAAPTTTTTARSTTTTAKGATTTSTTAAPDAAVGTVRVPVDPVAATSTTVPLSPVVTLGAADQGDDGSTTPVVVGLLVVLSATLITGAWYFRPKRTL